jgi:hypothetical protein
LAMLRMDYGGVGRAGRKDGPHAASTQVRGTASQTELVEREQPRPSAWRARVDRDAIAPERRRRPPTPPEADPALQARAAAARQMLRNEPGLNLDERLDLLLLVICPTPALEQAPERMRK